MCILCTIWHTCLWSLLVCVQVVRWHCHCVMLLCHWWQITGSWFICRRHWCPALSAWICQWNIPLRCYCHQQRACRHYKRSVCYWQREFFLAVALFILIPVLWRWISICLCRLVYSNSRFESVWFDWLNESIPFPTILDRAIWLQLVGVCLRIGPVLWPQRWVSV